MRNVRQHPHVSLAVTEEEGDRRSAVVIDGTARLMRPQEAPLEVRAPFRDDDGVLPEWVEAILVVTPERILSYSDLA